MSLAVINRTIRFTVDKHMELVRGDGYMYFVYDRNEVGINVYETKSVYVYRVKNLPKEQWVADAMKFMNELEVKYPQLQK